MALVRKNNGNSDDARDLFQEGVLALYVNIRQGRYQVQEGTRLSTYFCTLCRNLWISRLRKQQPVRSLEEGQEFSDLPYPETAEEQEHRITVLRAHFRQLGPSCQQLLNRFYYQRQSLREIAGELGLELASAKNKKYRCMEKLRSMYQHNH